MEKVLTVETFSSEERDDLVNEIMSDMKAQVDELYNEGMTQLEKEICLVLSEDRFTVNDILKDYIKSNGEVEFQNLILNIEKFYKDEDISEYPSTSEIESMVDLLQDNIDINIKHIVERDYGRS